MRSCLRSLLIAAFCGVAAANVIHVPHDAPTIQAGLDSLQDYDTVLVATGTYAEALIAPALHFTLKGDVVPDTGEYPRPIIDPSPLPRSDSLGCLILPDSSWAVLEDLVFRNGPEMYPHRIGSVGGVLCLGYDLTVRRCVFDSLYHPLAFVPPGPNSLDIVDTLEDCTFRDMQYQGVHQLDFTVIALNCRFLSGNCFRMCYGPRGSRFRDCYFGPNPGGNGLVVDGPDVEVTNCVFTTSHLAMGTPLQCYSQSGMISNNVFVDCSAVEAVFMCTARGPNSYQVTDNIFLNNLGVGNGTCLWLRAEYWPGTGGTVEHNTFLDCYSSGLGNTIVCTQEASVLLGNRIEETHAEPENRPAVHLSSGWQEVLHQNLFLGTGWALRNAGGAVDAEWNWWGDSTGPYHAVDNPGGLGDTVTGSVDFAPWYGDTNSMAVPGFGKPLSDDFILETYPNPFNSVLHLTLTPAQIGIAKVELFDILGRKTKDIWSGPLVFRKDLSFDASSLASGIYFARVTDAIDRELLAMRKLVLLK